MKAIDLFAGLGGMSEGARLAGVDVVWAANHWDVAVRAHQMNHPGAEHVCQDLRQADWTRLPRFDLLLAAPACIPGDQAVVLGDRREVDANAVRVGDQLLTHMGRARRVVNVWRKLYTGLMVDIAVSGATKKPTRMTADHLVWARRRGGHLGRLGAPTFMRADSLRAGDYVSFPRVESELGAAASFVRASVPARVDYQMGDAQIHDFEKNGRPVSGHQRAAHTSNMPGAHVVIDPESPDLWWLVGHYLGDGQARADRPELGWSVGGDSDNLARVRAALAALGLRSWTRGPATNVTVFASSSHLRAICEPFGRLAHQKHIPTVVLGFERRHLQAIVEGYLDADGSERAKRNPAWQATSTSLALLQGLQQICWQLGWAAGLSVAGHARTSTIEGRSVNCRDTWTLLLVKTPHAQSRTKHAHPVNSQRDVDSRTCALSQTIDTDPVDTHDSGSKLIGMKTTGKTETVTGRKIAKKRAQLERIEERLGHLMTQRADVEDELAELLRAEGQEKRDEHP